MTIQDILAREPGVQVTSLFGGVNGAQTTVDMRGFGATASNNTLILINGRRINDLDLAGVDLSSIPRESIDHIEITRGNSGAVLYGDGAVGGVINIVLKNGANLPPSGRVTASVGSFRYGEGSVGDEHARPVRGRCRSTAMSSARSAIARTTCCTSRSASATSATPATWAAAISRSPPTTSGSAFRAAGW